MSLNFPESNEPYHIRAGTPTLRIHSNDGEHMLPYHHFTKAELQENGSAIEVIFDDTCLFIGGSNLQPLWLALAAHELACLQTGQGEAVQIDSLYTKSIEQKT